MTAGRDGQGIFLRQHPLDRRDPLRLGACRPAELEARRRRAVALLEEGLGVREVARQIGCSPASVSRWQAEVEAGGPDALRAKPLPGRPPRLTAPQKQRLLRLLLKSATAHGYSTDL